jgi:hypothetical protein
MALAPIAAVASIAASGYSAYKTATAKPPAAPVLPPTPNAKDDALLAEVHRAQGVAMQRKRATAAFGRSDTILTGPAGVTAPRPVIRKTLLGE